MNDLSNKLLELEAEFYSLLNDFQTVYVKYHDQMVTQPITETNIKNLSTIITGLKTLSESFAIIPLAYQELCATKGVEI